MVDVEVFLVFVVDVDFELRDLVFGFGGDDQVVGGEDLELLTLVLFWVLLRREFGGDNSYEVTNIFEGNIGIFLVILVVCQALDTAEEATCK